MRQNASRQWWLSMYVLNDMHSNTFIQHFPSSLIIQKSVNLNTVQRLKEKSHLLEELGTWHLLLFHLNLHKTCGSLQGMPDDKNKEVYFSTQWKQARGECALSFRSWDITLERNEERKGNFYVDSQWHSV